MSLNAEKNYGWEVFLEVLDYQDSDATNKINDFWPRCSCTSDISQCEFMMEEFELVVAGEYNFETGAKLKKPRFLAISYCQDTVFHCKELKSANFPAKISLQLEFLPVVSVKYLFKNREKLKLKSLFWKFRTIKILMHERKTMISHLNTRVQVLCFRMRFYWRKSNWWWLKGKSLDINRNLKKRTFWNNWTDTNPMHASKQKVFYSNCFQQIKNVRRRLWLEETYL